MPKSLDKKKSAKKRRSDANESVKSSKPALKKKKLSADDGIAKSKQLASTLQNRIKTRSATRPSKSTEPRVFGNGKVMPSLVELEKMYEDSDDDETPGATVSSTFKKCKTPERALTIPEDKSIPISPKTINSITTKVLNLISNLPIIADGPPPPIIPQKKRKKCDKPYIDGCKDRPQVPWCPKTSFCKGDDKYGVDENNDSSENEDIAPNRRKGRNVNLSKSIFNAKSDEIAARLKECEAEECNVSSPDSNGTEVYDYSDLLTNSRPRSFSPLPSTSRDNHTISHNDELFNESLNETLHKDVEDHPPDEVSIIEILDDTLPSTSKLAKRHLDANDDSCIIIDLDIDTTDTVSTTEAKRDSASTVKTETDYYSTLDLTQNFVNDVCEIIDVDEVIAKNKAVIEKYKKEKLDTVVLVEPSTLNASTSRDVALSQGPDNSQKPNQSNTASVRPARQNSSGCVETQRSPHRERLIMDDSLEYIGTSERQHIQSENGEIIELGDNDGIQRALIRSDNLYVCSSPPFNCFSNKQNTPTARRLPAMAILPMGFDLDTLQSHEPRQTSQRNVGVTSRANENCTVGQVIASFFSNPENIIRSSVPPGSSITANSNAATPNKNQIDNNPKEPKSLSRPRLGDCPICMDNLSNKAIASTLCGHIFCMDCIKAAIKANGRKCPTCRMALKKNSYHQIFL